MRILFFMSFHAAPEHRAAEIELIYDHVERGDNVIVAACAGAFEGCTAVALHRGNLLDRHAYCLFCKSSARKALTIVGVKKIISLYEHPGLSQVNLPEFSTLAEYMEVTFDGSDVGRAAASSLLSSISDVSIDITKYSALARAYLKSAINSHLIFKDILEIEHPDLIYVFNGRFAEIKPLIRLAEAKRISYRCHEINIFNKKFTLTENALPHSISAITREIELMWRSADREHVKRQVDEWLQRAIAGQTEVSQKNFVGAQARGQLPAGFNHSKVNIAVYHSSEDETFTLDESVRVLFFRDQVRSVAYICEQLIASQEFHVYYRLHPRLAQLGGRQQNRFLALSYPNLTIIPAQSPVDSYALLRACDKVLSFGSTIGVEATYWGLPSIQGAAAFYQNLGATYVPGTPQEMIEMLTSNSLPKLSTDGVYKYFNWVLNRGQNFNNASSYLRACDMAGRGEPLLDWKGEAIRHISRVVRGPLQRRMHKCFHDWNWA